MTRPTNCLVQVNRKAIGLAVRLYMKNSRMTYAEFTEQTGINGATLQRLFAGRCRYIETVLTALHFCGLELNEFLRYEPDEIDP